MNQPYRSTPLVSTSWRWAIPAYVHAILILALVFAGLLPAQVTYAASESVTYFTVPLSGVVQIPVPGDPNGTGVAHLSLDPVGGTVCYVIQVDDVELLTAGHIHEGTENSGGNVAVLLFDDPANAGRGCSGADAATINAIIANPANYYVNLHNDPFPSGAVRGQLNRTATTFIVTVENVSGGSDLPGPFAPGVYAVHDATTEPLFTTGQADRGAGLEALAEDGGAATLGAVVAGTAGVSSSGVFSIPVGADSPGPITPGGAYQFQITAGNGDHLSLATMLVQSNDVFVAPAPTGMALFDGSGNPVSGDVTAQFPLWDAGTEVNEAPGMGPNQAPRQGAANTGPAEGGINAFSNSTRSLPLAGGLVDVSVAEAGGTFTISVTNVSSPTGALDTPIAPVFYATHNADWALFSSGMPASAGLESLAEDGSPVALVGEHSGATGTGMVGAQPITVERPTDAAGPANPGETFSFTVTPTIAYPYLTIAAMVVQSNDAFLAFDAKGVALLDYAGNVRSNSAILADINRKLAVWDAGTEANEVPHVGNNQPPRQGAANTGPVDPTPGVRIYSDSTNDLAGENAGGFAVVDVTNGVTPGTFTIALINTSDSTAYPGLLTPMVWAIHSGDTQLFEVGQPASAGLQSLAEDGNPAELASELSGNAAVLSSGVIGSSPIAAGGSFNVSVTADGTNRYVSMASMIVPSNDTFLAFEPTGLRIMNEDGTPRTNEEIAADIAATRLAWDAGTERNQAGAGGPDQAPRQAGPNTGADEGSGNVTLISSDTVWDYPEPSDVVRIVVDPQPVINVIQAEAALPADTARAATTFTVRVENISGDSDIPGPFAPGVWAVHDASRPLFSNNQPDRGQGLEGLAEDGAAGDLSAALSSRTGVASSGVFNTPLGATDPGPIFPGGAYEFQFTTTMSATRLSLATMFVQSNDIFAAPAAEGLLLFDNGGNPISGDITDQLPLWDAGTEVNEAPGMGPNQAPRQGAPNTGAHEGVVSAFTNSTRSLPLAGGIVDVAVSESGGTYTFTITNTSATTSATSSAIDTPVAPIFYATHNDQWTLFTNGETASAGLESLAEDGSPAALVTEHTGAAGTDMVGAQAITVQRPGDPAGPAAPGESFLFSVTPTATYPSLSMAMMVVETNDAFLAFGADGVPLLNSDGSPRSVADVSADINRELAVWDAGTEANEVPGVGPNQAPRQAGANTGPADPTPGVRIYSDATNDLAGSLAGGFASMTIEHGPMPLSFIVTISNTSGSTVYPGALTPVAFATHSDQYQLFTVGELASAGLEALSEDGNASILHGEFDNAIGVGHHGVRALAVGASGADPIGDGGAYRFIVMPDAAHPYLSVASMIVPSNDTFLAFGGQGIRLLDENGVRRNEADIATDIASDLIAWDAGTERNQAGAAGPDQAPRQAAANTGADEGSGNVTLISSDSVWDYPNISDLLRVTITPEVTSGGITIYLPLAFIGASE
ncbi:MAG: spondin domain-containing protein [Chloroflexota bacterium]